MINTLIKKAGSIPAPGLKEILEGYVERGEIPGLVALVSRNGHVQVETAGTLALGGSTPVQRDPGAEDDQPPDAQAYCGRGLGMSADIKRTSPEPPRVCSDFWTCIYRNIE